MTHAHHPSTVPYSIRVPPAGEATLNSKTRSALYQSTLPTAPAFQAQKHATMPCHNIRPTKELTHHSTMLTTVVAQPYNRSLSWNNDTASQTVQYWTKFAKQAKQTPYTTPAIYTLHMLCTINGCRQCELELQKHPPTGKNNSLESRRRNPIIQDGL